jgi:hypothetical protein
MELMQPVPQTPQPVPVSAVLPALIIMLMIHHAQLIQVSAQASQAPLVREVSATALVIPTALLTVRIVVVIMVTAAAGSAVSRKPVVLMIAIAMPGCVIIPRLIAQTNAKSTYVIMVFVLRLMVKATVKRIAANWLSPKGRSLIFWMTTIAAPLTMPTP